MVFDQRECLKVKNTKALGPLRSTPNLTRSETSYKGASIKYVRI